MFDCIFRVLSRTGMHAITHRRTSSALYSIRQMCVKHFLTNDIISALQIYIFSVCYEKRNTCLPLFLFLLVRYQYFIFPNLSKVCCITTSTSLFVNFLFVTFSSSVRHPQETKNNTSGTIRRFYFINYIFIKYFINTSNQQNYSEFKSHVDDTSNT